jgi:hypothetical protein
LILDTLTPDHLEAVLTHEQAHHYYRDTFCFFWLGWIRQVTPWLPQTQTVWQELLLLRELRADRWASARTDSLLLAETLLLVVEQSTLFPEGVCAAFSNIAPPHRLVQRIEALLSEPEPISQNHFGACSWILFAALPLIAIPFHH